MVYLDCKDSSLGGIGLGGSVNPLARHSAASGGRQGLGVEDKSRGCCLGGSCGRRGKGVQIEFTPEKCTRLRLVGVLTNSPPKAGFAHRGRKKKVNPCYPFY